MNNSLYHIFNEVKNGRLPKENAIEILRRFEMAQVPAGATDAGGFGDIMLEPVWQEKEVFNRDPEAELGYEYYLLLVCEQLVNLTEHGLQRVLERVGGTGRFLILHSAHQDPGQRFQDYGCQVFTAIQDLLGSHPKGKGLIQLVIPNQGTGQLSGGLAGMLKTARSENPKVLGQVIEIEPEAGAERIIAKLAENRMSPKDLQIRYDLEKRWIQVWQEIAPPQPAGTIPWKDRGVYLITGGVGGLGLIFAEEIARNVDQPTIILIGRSVLDAAKQAALNRIERYGARVIYQPVDVTSKEAVERLMKTIQSDPGTLNGIIHAAGVIRDNLIRNKTVEEVKAVLAPKVSGLVNLDEASLAVDLDFLVLFSSGAAAFGNAGQVDYAAANAFMDQYANYRNALVARGERCGKTISINWPLWNDGGMQIAEAFQKQIAADTGSVPLQTAAGVRAFSQIMALNRPQMMVMAGELAKLRELLSGGATGEVAAVEQGPHPVAPISATDWEEVKQKTIDRFKGLLSETANLSPDQIEADVPFDQYGVDSLLITQLNQKLTTVYGQLSKTVFYEYQTLESLVDYLVAEYPQNCLQWTGMGQRESSASESAEAKVAKRGFSHLRPVQPKKIPERHYHWRGALGKQSREPIAIIGIAGQFPQARNIEEYWENLRAGKECITEIPEARWPLADFYQPDKAQAIMQGKSYNKWGAFIADYDQFDPLFFNLTPREAELIDPQERLFLTECWKALEDAGYAPSGLAPKVRRRTGVFAGITKQGFNLYTLGTARHLPATSFASLVNRVSYFLDLQGPSMPIDTMCSSSLVAIHEACEYLRNGRGDLALAGGVNLYLHPATYVGLSSVQLLSETRECRSFGKGGTGFVPGEGVGVVVLKRFKQALNDGDHIYALIKGSAVNHKGKNKGYTIPEPNQQAAVIRQALAENRIDPRTVSYIEACANGSEMGDAIEMRALQKVFRQRNQVEGDYRIGSVKPNIGHCESASGMSQLVKVVLALRRQTLPPTIVSGELNPEIDYRQFPFEIQRELTAWKPVVVDGVQVPRRAGINNIGAGGVNAHLILEEYIPASADVCDEAAALEEHLFVLSAKNQAELEQYVKSWIEYLRRNPGIDPGDLTYTLQVGREAMPSRLALIIKTAAELGHKLELWLTDRENLDFGFGGDLKVTQRILRDEVTEAIQARNLSQLARLWTLGNAIPWNHLHPHGKRHRTGGLPTYPFNQRKCWSELNRVDQTGRREPMAPIHQEHANKAVEFYTLTASERARDFREEYLTFCPFLQKIPGFSMTRVYINPEQYPAEAELVKAKQIEMRQVLFYREDFNRVHSLFDIGCGHGTDVIQIAALYPHLKTQGFTITQAQAELGNQRITQMGLNAQAQIFHRDSAKDAFPGQYDLIIGIEVSFHIRNKDGVFHNIATALNPGGKVLLIDYIANLRGPIVDPQVEVSISTLQDWVRILSQHQLVIDELIDVSPQIANFLADPDFEQNTAHLPKVVQDTFRNYANQSISLEKGWLSYCLFKLRKDTQRSETERREYNATQIARKIPYAEALADMVKRGHIPYPKPHPTFTSKRDAPLPEVSESRREVAALTPIAAAVPVHDGAAIKRDLEEIFATVLGLQREDIQAGTFEELGVGSLNAIQLLEGINSRFDLQLPTSIIFEYNNLHYLAQYLRDYLQANHLPGAPTDKRDESQLASGEQGRVALSAQAAPNVSQGNAAVDSSGNRNRTDATEITEDIAIIGLSCRCAGANDQEQFWNLIRQGESWIQEIQDQNWLEFFQLYSPEHVPARYGRMADLEYFDPLFFKISPKEAAAMDVAQRILLEECYNALADSGYAPEALRGQAVGTFIGTMGTPPLGEDLSHLSMLGSDTSILAARIAYFLDLKGPALAINTACSSSLVAIDLACQKLKAGNIDLAIAGGITVYNHPAAFVLMNNAGMLSPTGECRPFDNAASGIVVGDGAGVVILKRLAEAVRDRDSIYGVIRGSGTNQDGQTSGITVPSSQSQSELQESVYRKHRIQVEELQYIEAHGTATKLGDPIEIQALTHSFRKFTSQKQFCGIGSLKANIGHTTAASGVLSVIKVLLSLKHRQIPPSINYETANQHIDFGNSPVYVNTELKEWPLNRAGSRLAAVSSFGFSGTNAHLVLEDYPETAQAATGLTPVGGLFILSAQSQRQIALYAQKTVTYLQTHAEVNLEALIHTFQVGRESMPYRLAFVVNSKAMLIAKLEQFIAGKGSRYFGKVNQETVNISETEEGQEFIRNLVRRHKLENLAELWVKGNEVNWEAVYPEGAPQRLAGLPACPFERQPYPMTGSKHSHQKTPAPGTTAWIHPLVQRNTSTLSEQRFSSTFTGREFFLADHVVKGQSVLPGVVYLEMARAAVEQAAEVLKMDRVALRLQDVIWVRPVTVGTKPVQLHIGIVPKENAAFGFEVYSEPEKPLTQPLVHSQGIVRLTRTDEAPVLDIATIRGACNRRKVDSREIYTGFETMGIQYGPAHRGIETMYAGPQQVLARLCLPEAGNADSSRYILHPALMDAALQASIGLLLDPEAESGVMAGKPILPFGLEELMILGDWKAIRWVWVRYSEGSKAGDPMVKLDFDLCGEQGQVGIRIKGYTSRVLEGEVGVITAGAAATQTLMFERCWVEEPEPPTTANLGYSQRLVVFCDYTSPDPKVLDRITGHIKDLRCLVLPNNGGPVAERYQAYALKVFEEIQGFLKERPQTPVLLQVVVPNQGEPQICAGLSGLLKTARLENPNLIGQLIVAPELKDGVAIAARLEADSLSPIQAEIRYENEKRFVAGLRKIDPQPESAGIPWRDQGVYLITGGAGGLGRIFAQEIMAQVKDATLILTGRTALEPQKLQELADSVTGGNRIVYRQTDVTDWEAVAGLIQSIQDEFKTLNGIIHSAGVIHDNFILQKSREEFAAVMAPKVDGLANLDLATQNLELDFLMVFSSLAGVMGNPGQADYAAANVFMDAYVQYRNGLTAKKQRHGRAIAINWALWESGGMDIGDEAKKILKQKTGVVPMKTGNAIKAFYQAIALGYEQVLIGEADPRSLAAEFLIEPSDTAPTRVGAAADYGAVLEGDQLREKTVLHLKKILATVINLPPNRIEAEATFENYGIDSVMVMQMTQQLENSFGALPKTLFFEYRNIGELAGYFLTSHSGKLDNLLGRDSAAAAPTSAIVSATDPGSGRLNRLARGGSSRLEAAPEEPTTASNAASGMDIAVIGLAGRYPGAGNTRQFWENLQNGKDCITEIPQERWDHSRYFDADPNKPGTTYSKWGGFLEGVDRFDPLFFNISPSEAAILDPQERLFLECVYETLEDAGYTREALQVNRGLGLEGNVGVYVGVMYEEYQLYGAQEQARGNMITLSGSPASIANRISYFCNFHGPSMTIDTMCSSSLTAIHLACQSIQKGGCELAIAGGVNVSIHPNKYLALGRGRFVSSKGRCESFGEGGEGYVPGEGVGAILLKPLNRAVADGDQIYGVIRGTAINHGGKTHGYSVPNLNAQSDVINRALQEAGIHPRTISYLEAHGTGTALGDPIEIGGVGENL